MSCMIFILFAQILAGKANDVTSTTQNLCKHGSSHDLDASECATQLLQQRLQVDPKANSQDRPPSMALIILDNWRWDYAGFDEPNVSMPTLHQLAADGTRFTHAYVPSPSCVPSRCAFAAGRNHQNMWNKRTGEHYSSPNSTPTFMSLLQQAGYTTLVAGKDGLSNESDENDARLLGFDMSRRCLDKYRICHHQLYGEELRQHGLYEMQCAAYGGQGKGLSCNATEVCEDQGECGFRCDLPNSVDAVLNIDQWVEQQAETLLAQHWAFYGKEKPWFLQIGFPSPHPPFIVTADEYKRTASKNFPHPVDAHFEAMPDAQNINLLESQRQYAALIERLDFLLEAFVGFLKQADVFEETVIIITSDHGEHLGDHTEYFKESPWEEANRVPLVVKGPGILKQVLDRPVATLDMVATMLELANRNPLAEMNTRSMLPLLKTGQQEQRVILSGYNSTTGFDGRIGGFESAAKLYNATAFLRVVCCPLGCIKQGSMLPITSAVQMALMNVTPGVGPSKYEHNILNQPQGRGVAEAAELLKYLSDDHRDACLQLL